MAGVIRHENSILKHTLQKKVYIYLKKQKKNTICGFTMVQSMSEFLREIFAWRQVPY